MAAFAEGIREAARIIAQEARIPTDNELCDEMPAPPSLVRICSVANGASAQGHEPSPLAGPVCQGSAPAPSMRRALPLPVRMAEAVRKPRNIYTTVERGESESTIAAFRRQCFELRERRAG
jgi:hypothetical protein